MDNSAVAWNRRAVEVRGGKLLGLLHTAVFGLAVGLALQASPAEEGHGHDAAHHGVAEAIAGIEPLRADGSQVAPTTLRYRIAVTVAGEEYAFHSVVDTSRQSWAGNPAWRIETRARMPAGDVLDTVYLGTEDLVAVHRDVRVGQGRVSLDLGLDGVSGTIVEPGGEARPIAISSDGPVVGHMATALAGASLASRFEALFRTLDLQRQTIHAWRASVGGLESVEVPAGRFEAYRLELVDLDGHDLAGTVWMTGEAPRRMVRSQLIDNEGGGTIIAELTPARD